MKENDVRSEVPKKPTLQIDYDAYLKYADDLDLNDSQKRELVATLYQMMLAFVDVGFGIDAVGQACGQDSKTTTTSIPNARNDIKSNHQNLTDDFEMALQTSKAVGTKGS